MYKFEAFNTKSIPHIEYSNTNMLTNVTSNNDDRHDRFSIELICRSSIPDNSWRIFDDNQHNIHSLH